jgi:hypothetical protein
VSLKSRLGTIVCFAALKARLRTVFCCAVLEVGALTGMPMRVEEIRALMEALAKPKVARENPDRPDEGDRLPDTDDSGVRIRRGWWLLPRPPGRVLAAPRPARRGWRRWRIF